ncbi:MAG: hypothetical protein HYY09_03455, partial [Firmicutes bacterium]|nr:hypothetical protein [Bacillota bacterium]
EAELKGAGLRVHTDGRPQYTPGWKFNEWEMRGVPVRLEIGPRDVEKNQVVLARRDTGEKSFVPRTDLAAEVRSLLDSVQEGIYRRAAARMVEMTAFSGNFEDFKEIMADRRGFIRAPWCGDSACEASVKSDTGATIRCIPLEAGAITGDPAGAAAGTGAAQAEATGGPETGEAPDDGPAIPAGLNGPVGPGSGRCLVCDREAKHLAYFARAY